MKTQVREIDLTAEPTGTRVRFQTKSGSNYVVTIGSHEDDDVFAHHLTIESDTTSDAVKVKPSQQGKLVSQKEISVGRCWGWGLGFQTSPVIRIEVERP